MNVMTWIGVIGISIQIIRFTVGLFIGFNRVGLTTDYSMDDFGKVGGVNYN